MPASPTFSGPATPVLPDTGGGGGGGGFDSQWTPLTDAMLSGAVAGVGTRITTIDSAWATSGQRVSATATVTVSTDGIPEGYTLAVRATELVSVLGTTEDDLRNGAVSLLVAMRQRSDPGSGALAGVAIARSSDETGDVDTLTGGGGGWRASTSDSETISPAAFDSTQDSPGSIYHDVYTSAAVTRLECFAGRWAATASMQVDGQAYLAFGENNDNGLAGVTEPLWLVIWLGGAVNGQVSCDMDVWFALAAGPNFNEVPD